MRSRELRKSARERLEYAKKARQEMPRTLQASVPNNNKRRYSRSNRKT